MSENPLEGQTMLEGIVLLSINTTGYSGTEQKKRVVKASRLYPICNNRYYIFQRENTMNRIAVIFKHEGKMSHLLTSITQSNVINQTLNSMKCL